MTKEGINNRSIQAINWLLDSNVGLTKTALADSFAIKPAKFSEILNGRMNVGTEIMAALCANYNISSNWLLTGRGEMLQSTSKQATEPSVIYKSDPKDAATIADKQMIIDRDAELIAALRDKIRSLESNLSAHQTGLYTAHSVGSMQEQGTEKPRK